LNRGRPLNGMEAKKGEGDGKGGPGTLCRSEKKHREAGELKLSRVKDSRIGARGNQTPESCKEDRRGKPEAWQEKGWNGGGVQLIKKKPNCQKGPSAGEAGARRGSGEPAQNL